MFRSTTILALAALLGASTASAMSGKPLPTKAAPSGTPRATSESSYNDGLALAQRGDFVAAEIRFREAIALNPRLPEAWNGLGHALKMQRRFEDAQVAYDEALRLRPDFPLALEYLGELYVATGELDKARDMLSRLSMVDRAHADLLAQAIDKGSVNWPAPPR